MTFIPPMLAYPLKDDETLEPDVWVAEEKYDGIRLCVSVAETGGDLFGHLTVMTYSRYGKIHAVPPHVRVALEALPSGVYDGELYAPGKRSYGTAALANAADVIFVIFDVTELLGRSTVGMTYETRREYLAKIFTSGKVPPGPVQLSWVQSVNSRAEAQALAERVWARDGEGLILKRREGLYRVGKRDKTWRKVKTLRSAVLVLVGFVPGKLGPHATTLLRDDDGNETTVKWKDYVTLAYFDQHTPPAPGGAWTCEHEPRCIGRRVRIEFQERTQPDNGYRHPRWDRFEDE